MELLLETYIYLYIYFFVLLGGGGGLGFESYMLDIILLCVEVEYRLVCLRGLFYHCGLQVSSMIVYNDFAFSTDLCASAVSDFIIRLVLLHSWIHVLPHFIIVVTMVS